MRVALGYVVLIVLPAILLVVQISTLRSLLAVNQRNSGDNLRIILTIVELVRDRDAVEEQARGYFTQGDQASKDEMKDFLQSFENGLREIQNYHGSDKEQAEANRLVQFWREFSEALSRQDQGGKAPSGGIPPELADQLARLRAQSLTVYQATVEDMKKQAEDSRKSSERTEFVAWWIGGATLVLGILISFIITRSISGPLRNLSEGTRAIVEGKSFYRLDTSRKDEFSQIAKDFNTLTEKLEGRAGVVAGGTGERKL